MILTIGFILFPSLCQIELFAHDEAGDQEIDQWYDQLQYDSADEYDMEECGNILDNPRWNPVHNFIIQSAENDDQNGSDYLRNNVQAEIYAEREQDLSFFRQLTDGYAEIHTESWADKRNEDQQYKFNEIQDKIAVGVFCVSADQETGRLHDLDVHLAERDDDERQDDRSDGSQIKQHRDDQFGKDMLGRRHR